MKNCKEGADSSTTRWQEARDRGKGNRAAGKGLWLPFRPLSGPPPPEAVSGSAWVGDWGCVSFKSYPFTARGGPAKARLGTDEALEGDECVISGFRAVAAKSSLPLSHILLSKEGIPVPGTLNLPQEGPSLLSSLVLCPDSLQGGMAGAPRADDTPTTSFLRPEFTA